MAFIWNTNEMVASIVTVYPSNLTLNKAACSHFEKVRYVLLGIDYEAHHIGIKPVSQNEIDQHIYPPDQLHKISIGKSYGRITSKSFIETLTQLLDLDFLKKNCFKFKATYDIIQQVLVIDYSKGENVL